MELIHKFKIYRASEYYGGKKYNYPPCSTAHTDYDNLDRYHKDKRYAFMEKAYENSVSYVKEKTCVSDFMDRPEDFLTEDQLNDYRRICDCHYNNERNNDYYVDISKIDDIIRIVDETKCPVIIDCDHRIIIKDDYID